MRIAGQEINDKIVARIQRTIDGNPGLSRVGLSRRICEDLRWRSTNGRLKEVNCRTALLKLHRRGAIRLPEAATFPTQNRPSGERPKSWGEEPMRAELKDCRPVELIVVRSSEESRIWNDVMNRYHYLGAGPLCGAQLRYLIGSAKHGWLGGLSFSSAAWSVKARDIWIGWNAQQREQKLNMVISNSRFLILPHVVVPHLASHVLGLSLRRLGQDWKQRYGYEPLLVETFIEQSRFDGICYRAANWIEVGQTQGRGRQDRNHRRTSPIKSVWVYALDSQARERLCEGGTRGRSITIPEPPEDWAESEFGHAGVGDERLRQRLLEIARDFYARPQAQIPQACQSRARTKAAYRFFKHQNTEMDVLLEPHHRATQQRIADKKIVLAIQDTTSLNYSTHPATQNLGPIASKADGILGLLVHDTMAFSSDGTPLGLLDVQCWARDGSQFGKKHQRRQRPIEDKESNKWLMSFRRVAQVQRECPNTMLVSVGDREGDVYELFHLALQDPHGPKLLIRAEHDRLLTDGQAQLLPALVAQPLAGIQEIHVPRRGARAARLARLQVRFAEVVLKPPQGKSQLGSLKLWAVLADETSPAEGIQPLRWILLTTCSVTRFAAATEKLVWYTKRWCIEIYHKSLKSGCKIEERQLGDAENIEACLAIDMVVAWRIYHLAKIGRETPDVACTVFFEDAEWKALHSFINKYPYPPDQPPSLREAMHMVAGLGGFLGRKSDGEPGTKSLWLGLQRLDDLTIFWKLVVPHLRPPPVSSKATYG